MTRPRILLADDHALLLDAFKALLEPEFEVVGAVTDGRMLLTEFARLYPDVVVLDIAMPLLNGLDAGRKLRADRRSAKLIYLTMNPDPNLAGEALRLGASGYVLKSSAATELKQAIPPRSTAGRVRRSSPAMSSARCWHRLRRGRSRAAAEVLQLLAEEVDEVAPYWTSRPERSRSTARMMEQRAFARAPSWQFAVETCRRRLA